MTELEELFAKIEKTEPVPEQLSEEELLSWLNDKSREVGRKQSRVSSYSEEYKTLGEYRADIERAEQLLRKKGKEQSGLTPAEQEEENLAEVLYHRYVRTSLDGERQKLYREVVEGAMKGNPAYVKLLGDIALYEKTGKRQASDLYKAAAEKGDRSAAELLAKAYEEGQLVEKSERAVKKYTDLAADAGNPELLFHRAKAYLQGDASHAQNEELAFRDFCHYIKKEAPLDMAKEDHRYALTLCYELGYKLGIDMSREDIPEHWSRLQECKGAYSEIALKLKGDELISKGEYVNGIQAYLDAKTLGATEALQEVYFGSFLSENASLRKQLDQILAKRRDDITTAKDIRMSLYAWYAMRHTTGKDAVRDYALAFVYYARIREMTNDNKLYDSERKKLSENMSINEKIAFYKEVYEKGYEAATAHIGYWYQEKKQYETAQEYYRMAVENATEQWLIDACKTNYEYCRKRSSARKRYREEAHVWYVKCTGTAAAGKKEAFLKLRELAEEGNTYACLRIAEIAEKKDPFYVDSIKNYPTEKQIFYYYEKAADAGEQDAVLRMVNIFAKGQLGQKQNKAESNKWSELL